MQNKLVARVLSAVLLGVLFGMSVHAGYAKWNRLGYSAFVSFQQARFDRYMFHLQPESRTLLTFVVAALIAAAAYELVVLGVWKLSKFISTLPPR